MPDVTLGVDLSDLAARIAVVDGEGQVRGRADATPGPHSAAEVRDAAKRALAGHSGRVAAIGVAMPASGDEVPADIVAALREATSRKTEVLPIAAGTALAIAEQWCGAARGVKHVVAFAMAEHVAAGVLIDGEPFRGAHGLASAIGWLAVNPVEREDYRRYGGLEAELGSAGIVRRFVWRIKSGDDSAVADKVNGDFAKITAHDIFEGSRAGDGVSVSVVRDTAKYVGMAIANMSTVLDPEVIVLGGVIAQCGDLMLEPIKAECTRRQHPQQADVVQIVLATLGDDAVAIGAARAAARAGA